MPLNFAIFNWLYAKSANAFVFSYSLSIIDIIIFKYNRSMQGLQSV